MGRWRWINLSEARTINIGTNKQQSKSIGMVALLWRWKMAVAWRRQKKVVLCGHDDSLMWRCQGDDGTGSTPARQG
jgi:hypothetical protein